MSRRSPSAGVRAAATLTRHAAVYTVGSSVALALSMANAIVLTHFLGPAQYGRIGLALVTASFVTIALNAPILHGALFRAVGRPEGQDDGPDAEAEVEAGRRAFGTAFLCTAGAGLLVSLVAVAVTTAVWGGERSRLISLAIASGSLGALWRLFVGIPRLRRQPGRYIVLSLLRPVAVLAISLPIVATGGGAAGAVAGVALGTALSCLVAGTCLRSAFVLRLDRTELKRVRRKSTPYVPLITGMWLTHSADLYVVAALAGATEVGEYRLASRLGAIASYGTSAFVQAWGPLELSSTFRASDDAHGRQALRGALLFAFLLVCLLLVLTLAVTADEFVRVAPAAYAHAAALLPALALGFTAQGMFVGFYRASDFPARATIYRKGTLLAGIIDIPLACGMVLLWGPKGAALAAATVYTALTIAMGLGHRRSGKRLGLPALRLTAAAALAAGLYVAATAPSYSAERAGLAVHAAAILLFLIAFPVIAPPVYRRSLLAVAHAAFTPRRASRPSGAV